MTNAKRSLHVFTGLPATGKTTELIETMTAARDAKIDVKLFLSNEHHELTRRPNVKPGGIMGCRTPGKNFPIDYVCSTEEAGQLLSNMQAGAVAVFDEAQFYSHEIVKSWRDASKRGVNVYVSSPSIAQLLKLKIVKHQPRKFTVDCSDCRLEIATEVVYKTDFIYPIHLCKNCKDLYMKNEITELLHAMKEADPFPGKMHTYQPFFGVDMSDFELIRGDSQARLNIILEAASRCSSVDEKIQAPQDQPTFLDLGCCSGFFADGMNHHGYRTTGVDVTKNFIEWAEKLAKVKGQVIDYKQQDAHQYLSQLETNFDVVSTFATVQWVMAQNDYEKGLECFEMLFNKTNHIAVVEMGYNTEEIYKDRIKGAPTIDKDWVQKMMEDLGDFHTIEIHPSGENGIWRDVFVGFKNAPTSETAGPILAPKVKKSLGQKARVILSKLS